MPVYNLKKGYDPPPPKTEPLAKIIHPSPGRRSLQEKRSHSSFQLPDTHPTKALLQRKTCLPVSFPVSHNSPYFEYFKALSKGNKPVSLSVCHGEMFRPSKER